MSEIESVLKRAIRDVPNFPKEGIIFKDITTVLSNPVVSKKVYDSLKNLAQKDNPDVIVGIDSRGFLYGQAIAIALDVPFVPVRKKGKLPYQTISESYELEYGSATLEMHIDGIKQGQRVWIHDDLLATGGTAEAAVNLVQQLGGEICGINFLVELSFLKGRKKLEKFTDNIIGLATY